MPLIQAAITDQAKAGGKKEPGSDKPGHGSWNQGGFGLKRSAGQNRRLTHRRRRKSQRRARSHNRDLRCRKQCSGLWPWRFRSPAALSLCRCWAATAPGSGGTINVAPGPVNTGARVGGAVSASAGRTSVNAGANVSLGGK